MHPQQKAAWFNLIVFAGAVALYLAAVALLSWHFHRPWTAVALPAAQGVFGLCGLWGCGVFFYKPWRKKKLVMDERDHLLATRAWHAGMVAFWEVFVFGCVGSWAYLWYGRGLAYVTLPVEFFPLMVFVAFILFGLTQSLATLHYYGWRWHDSSAK